MAQTEKQQPGPKKHVPQRMCIACRRGDAKRGLVRLVRDAAGRVSIDTVGKARGRGAYLCRDAACWSVALKRRAIERALKVEQLHPDDRAELTVFSAGLPALSADDAVPDSVALPSAADRTDTKGG